MVTLAESIHDRYGEAGADDDTASGGQGLVFIVSVSPSPQARAGKLPPMLTLIDYNIEALGEVETHKTGHIREMDLSDNLIMDWSTVNDILTTFPSLRFLNLARNLLSSPLPGNRIVPHNLSRVLTVFAHLEIVMIHL